MQFDANTIPRIDVHPVGPGFRVLLNQTSATAATGTLLDTRAAIRFEFDVVSEPGDYNRDGAVDAADYVVWRKSLGQSGPGLAADGNNDSLIDAGDYDVWRANFGTIFATGNGAITGASQVPEPTSLGLLLASFLFAARRRRTPVSHHPASTMTTNGVSMLIAVNSGTGMCCTP